MTELIPPSAPMSPIRSAHRAQGRLRFGPPATPYDVTTPEAAGSCSWLGSSSESPLAG